MKNVSAVIGDVVDSRKYIDREKIQKRLIYSINYLNECFKEYIIKEVEVSSGDSVQGLFNDMSTSFFYARMLQMMMTPVKVRIGIGFGDIEYLDETYTSNMLDGSAYHNARSALREIEVVKDNSVYVVADNRSKVILDTSNGLFKMYYQIKSKQSVKSHMIQLLYEVLNPLSMEGTVMYPINEAFLDNIKSADLEIIDEYNKLDLIHQAQSKINTISILDLSKNDTIASTLQYKTRGTADKIASITGTTRQNVQKFISKDIQDDVLNTVCIVNYLREVMV